SIIACRVPPDSPAAPGTGRGVLSSDDRPIDCARRRAGSTVSTTACLPRSAGRSPKAGAVVVLPAPPEPQQTMIRVRGSSSSRSTSRAGPGRMSGCSVLVSSHSSGCSLLVCSRHSGCSLLTQGRGQPVQPGQVHLVSDQRQVVTRLPGVGPPGPLGQLLTGVLGQLRGQAGGQSPEVLDARRLQAQIELVLVQGAAGRRLQPL